MYSNSVLVIDDDADIGEFIRQVVEECGLHAIVCAEPRLFREELDRHQPACVMTDLQMPDVDGIEVLRYLGQAHSQVKVVLLSGFDRRVMDTARRFGESLGLQIIGALEKPVRIANLKKLFETAKLSAPQPSIEELRLAVDNGEIEAHFQPKIALRGALGKHVVGFEALARWHHPRLGMVAPASFITLAEEHALIGLLTESMLRQTAHWLTLWAGLGHHLQVAVNLSPQLLSDLALPDHYARLLAERAISPTNIMLEVTESGAMHNVSQCMDILSRFRLKGFDLSIDDFGTGFSSLVSLYQMPFCELKIDRTFVMNFGEDSAQTIVKTIVSLAAGLSLSVCAEGVETQDALDFLAALGCDKVQGYLISPPLAGAAVADWLRSWPDAALASVPPDHG